MIEHLANGRTFRHPKYCFSRNHITLGISAPLVILPAGSHWGVVTDEGQTAVIVGEVTSPQHDDFAGRADVEVID